MHSLKLYVVLMLVQSSYYKLHTAFLPIAFIQHSSGQVANVRSAIARIGFNTLRALVSSLVMQQIAGASKNPLIRSKINQLWEHSAQVAALSQVLARRVTKSNPDTAMFAGIVHEVGGFYILSRAEEFPCLLEADDLDAPPLENEKPSLSKNNARLFYLYTGYLNKYIRVNVLKI